MAAALAAGMLASPLAFVPAAAGASLRLADGRLLEGVDVRREGDVYLLTLEGGAVIPVPVELVAEVGVTAAPPEQPAPAPPGMTYDEARTLAGGSPGAAPTDLPPGLTQSEARTLAGGEVRQPTPSEQTAVFGAPARFQPDIVRSNLNPTYWVMDPSENNWNPSKWAEAPTDPSWQPTPAFDPGKDVLAEGRSTWQKSPIDSAWSPTDAFAK